MKPVHSRQTSHNKAPLHFYMNTMQEVDAIMNKGCLGPVVHELLHPGISKDISFVKPTVSPKSTNKAALPKALLLSPKSQLLIKTKKQLNEANEDIKKNDFDVKPIMNSIQ